MKVLRVLLLLVTSAVAFIDKTIPQWLADSGHYTLMLTFLNHSNVIKTLEGSGPFTMFVVPDEAFNTVPAATLIRLTSDTTALGNMMKYHVISGFIIDLQMKDGEVRYSLNGKPLHFTKYPNNSVAVDGVLISHSDFLLNNGVVHVLDAPLLPVTETIAEQLIDNQVPVQDFLMVLLVTDEITKLMRGNWTLFAPSNAAIASVASKIPDFSDHAAAIAFYTMFAINHIVGGTIYVKDLHDGDTLTAASGLNLNVTVVGKDISVAGARLVTSDIAASNGVTHVIEGTFLTV